MPSSIWTPPAVESEGVRTRRRLWRAVEAQHIASTLRLVASADEQLILERLLESNKPALPPATQGLHYLLATPFRYASPHGSRFRAASDQGVWYGAEDIRTACAEIGYWRWRFLQAAERLDTLGPSPQTVFQAGVNALMVDLTNAPFKRDRARWMESSDYTATQAFARTARTTAVDAIRYESVRDPEHGGALAILRAQCFSPPRPLQQQTWFLTVREATVTWQREGAVFEFATAAWR